jgi:hypothetical protein
VLTARNDLTPQDKEKAKNELVRDLNMRATIDAMNEQEKEFQESEDSL